MPSLFTGSKYSSLILFPALHVPLSFQDCGFDREHWNVSPARNASQREAGGDESNEEESATGYISSGGCVPIV